MYYRLVRIGMRWYAVAVELDEDEIENLVDFVQNGELVLYTDDLEEAAEILDIDEEDIVMVS